MATSSLYPVLLFSFLTLSVFTESQPFIGVNYGQVGDNLPPPEATSKLLQSTTIEKVRLYGSDPGIIKALANTGIGITIGVSNSDIPAIASDPNLARNWIRANVIPFYPDSRIVLITAGNEVLSYNDPNLISQLLPAMRNLQSELDAAGLGGKIKVSTVHSMAVLQQSEPPSSGTFDPELRDLLKGLLDFNNETGSPFAINPYPYFKVCFSRLMQFDLRWIRLDSRAWRSRWQRQGGLIMVTAMRSGRAWKMLRHIMGIWLRI